ncbi:MAG: hypothetical protein KDD69_03065 [Bdellovibrionales bacterium]|nr:hypothetical protein [Bdellovibrionales bacterium]
MNMLRILCFVAAATAAFSTPVAAQSLAEKRQQAAWVDQVQSSIASTKQNCGKDVTVSFDVESWSKVPEDQKTFAFGEYCGACLMAMSRICGDELGKEAVTTQIDKVICRYHAEQQPKLVIDKATKTLDCSFDLHDMQFQAEARAALEKIL